MVTGGCGVAAGMGVGVVARWWLARLRRGVRAPPGVCEAVGAVLAVVVAWRWPALPEWWLPITVVLTIWAVPLVVVDLYCRRLPDALTWPAYPVFGCAVTVAAAGDPGPAALFGAAGGAAVYAVLHLAVRLVRPQAMGAGDVKLAGSLGIAVGAVGWPALAMVVCLASVVTALLAVVGAVLRTWHDGVPHGPGLVLAAWTVVLGHGAG